MFLSDIAHAFKWKTAKHITDIFSLKHWRLKGILKLVAGFVPLEHFLWVIWKPKGNLFLNYIENWTELEIFRIVSWQSAGMRRWCGVIKMNFRGSAACLGSMGFLGCIWRLLLSSLWPCLSLTQILHWACCLPICLVKHWKVSTSQSQTSKNFYH